MKQYKTAVYKIRGLITEQTVLTDLQGYLNSEAANGWCVTSTQLIGAAEFLIVFEK